MLTWDNAKRIRNISDHGIDFADLDSVFDFAMISVEDKRIAYGEKRIQSLAWYIDRVVFIVWTERDDSTHIISCRYGNKHETKTYFNIVGH
jgi:uncharacterized protein